MGEQVDLKLSKNFFKRLKRVSLVMDDWLPVGMERHKVCNKCDFYVKYHNLSGYMCKLMYYADRTCPVCSKVLETDHTGCSEQKLYSHMNSDKSHRHVRKLITWHRDSRLDDDEMRCPICEKVFTTGYYHLASQKLYSHMSHGKEHRG